MKSQKGIASFINHYVAFFLLVAFLVSCTTSLFITAFSRTMGITFTEENLAAAAKLTFLNVILLSILFTVIDTVRRKLTVERSVKRITDAAKRLVAGDFSARVELTGRIGMDESFYEITDCFNKMAQELSGVETLRTDFIANVSHELKTPLAVMQNYGTMLQQPGLSEEKRMEYAKAITDASRRLTDLITNILKLNKLENQQIYPTPAAYNLSEQLCQCLLQFEPIWEQKEIDIETDIEDSVTVSADEELLSLVWNNLLSNAFKFTLAGGTVALSLHSEDEYAIVTVKDTGCGMSADMGSHIFEKFYQGDSSHSMQGNGLGLALVKRVVDITRSEISVQSAPGEGSTFTVKLRREAL